MDRRQFFSSVATAAALPLLVSTAHGQLVNKLADDLNNGEFNWFPKRASSGPLLIIVSIPEQKVHVYRNGIRIAASTCSTGKPGHATPTGVFSILQKDKFHRSSTYNDAPMPNMNRLTWSGIALHAGQLPGYPASHGCVRLPLGFSELLFGITRKGMTVVIADNTSQPAAVVHPKLILGDFAGNKFGAVDKRIGNTDHADDKAHQLTRTSLVISGKDKTATLYENEYVAATSPVDIADPNLPLRPAVYHLKRSDGKAKELHWSGVMNGKGDRQDFRSELPRIKTPVPFAEEVHRRMHRGMVLVTTPDNHGPQNRTPNGFVIADGVY